MNFLRIILVVIFLSIFTYTVITISVHGVNLLPIFFDDISKMAWPGQFNVDFSCFLILSALWVSWRNTFSLTGILLGIIAAFGGALFLSAYMFIESFRVDGDIYSLLLGKERTNTLRDSSSSFI